MDAVTAFKAGDIVRCIKAPRSDRGDSRVGCIYTVQGVTTQRHPGGDIRVIRFVGEHGASTQGAAHRFELVPQKPTQMWLDAVGPSRLPKAHAAGRVPHTAPNGPTSTQVGGSHYTDMVIQPLDYVMANGIPFPEGNVIKYVSRWRKKGGVQDLKKARHMLDVLIEFEEKKANG